MESRYIIRIRKVSDGSFPSPPSGSGTTPPFPVADVVLRLVGGANTCEGRLEMLVGDGPTWARAYDSYFGTNEARVVCRQLGCPADEPVMANATRLVCRPSY